MDKPNSVLRALHALHIQLRELQDQVDNGPKKLKAREQFTQQKRTDLEAQRQKQKTLKMAADQKSLQLKTNEAKIQDLRGKLNAASSNREFDIIKSQIEADTVANSVLEDEILNHLEKVDAGQIAARKLEEELLAAQDDEKRTAESIAAALSGLNARIAEVQASIGRSETNLPGETLVIYKRLIQAYGVNAMAEVDGKTCSSCYVGLPPQHVVALNAGQILLCKTCGRLLYPRVDE